MTDLDSRAIEAAKTSETIAQFRKPVETFWLLADPLTGERFDDANLLPAIPVYDAITGELREFLP